MSAGADKLVIVLWSAGPRVPDGPALAAAPFVYALAARALEVDVDMHFTSSTVRWLLPGVADAAYTDAERTKTVGDFIREVKVAGVKLYACSMAMHEHARGASLIAECDGHAGAATVVSETLNPRTRTLIFELIHSFVPSVGTIKCRNAGADVSVRSQAMEAAMPEDVKNGSDPGDDLNLLAGVVALVSLALMATALLS